MRIIKSVAALCSAALLLVACDGDGAETKSAIEQPAVSVTNNAVSKQLERVHLADVDPFEYLVPESGYYVASPDGVMNCVLWIGNVPYSGRIRCDKASSDPTDLKSDMPSCPHWETDRPSRFELGFEGPCQLIIQGWSLRNMKGPFVPKKLEPGNRLTLTPGIGCMTDEEGVFSCTNNFGGFSYHDHQVHNFTADEVRTTMATLLTPAANLPDLDQCGENLSPAIFKRDLTMTGLLPMYDRYEATWRVFRGNYDPCAELSWVQFYVPSWNLDNPAAGYSATAMIFYSKGTPVYVVPGTSQHVEEIDSTHYRVSWYDLRKCEWGNSLPGVATLAVENGEFKATLESWDPSDTDPEHEGQTPPVQHPACTHPVVDPGAGPLPSFTEASADTGIPALDYVLAEGEHTTSPRGVLSNYIFAPTAPERSDLVVADGTHAGYGFRTADNKVGCYLLKHGLDFARPNMLCSTIEGGKLPDDPAATSFEAGPWILNQAPQFDGKPITQLTWRPEEYVLPRVVSNDVSRARPAFREELTQLKVGDSFSAYQVFQCTQETESLLSCSYGATTLQIDGTKVSVSLEP